MEYTEYFIFQDATFQVYEVIEAGLIKYSYRGRNDSIYWYECPDTFATPKLAVYAAKLKAIWWSMDTLMLPACIENLQNHEILLVNTVGRYFFECKPGQRTYDFTSSLESYCEFYRDLRQDGHLERKQIVYADGTPAEGVVNANIIELPDPLVVLKFG